MTEPGGIRPGGRTAAVRESVLRATGDLLVESGLDGLELTDVAERACVGKSTVYRRWGSATALVADLLCDMAERSSPRAHTGSLRGDLRANARLVHRTLTDPRRGPLFRAIIAAANCDLRTAKALEMFYDRRISEWSGCVVDGIARREAPVRTDPEAALRQVASPLYYQFLTSTRPLTVKDAERAVEAAMAAISKGVFVANRR